MKIEDIANIYQGIILSRIKNQDVQTEKCPIYSFIEDEDNYVEIPKDNEYKSQIPFTKKNMVLLNLTSHRASIIEEDEEDMVIPSTFIVLEPNGEVDSVYLEWYINESRDFKKSLHIIKQGSAILTIPIQGFKEIKVKLPPIEVQQKISRISKLMKEEKRLREEKEELFKKVLKYINQEGIINDK